MSTSEASRSREQLLRQVTEARGAPVTATGTGDVVAMAVSPRDALGDADAEWTMLDRAVLAMEARDWPAVIVPISRASLRAASLAYRLCDLMEQHGLEDDRLWLELDSSLTALAVPGTVAALARRHTVGCRMDGADAFSERALLPDLAAMGLTFAWVDDDGAGEPDGSLSALIAGRSLVRRGRVHGITIIGPEALGTDMAPPLAQ